MGAVGVALLLAQLHVQPRVEQPAEDRPEDRHRVEVGDPAGHADVPDADLGLRCTGLVDEPEPASAGHRLGDDRARARRPRRHASSRPSAGRPARPGRCPRGRRRRPGSSGPDRARASRPRSSPVAVERGDGRPRPTGRPVVGRVVAVDRRGEGLVGPPTSVGPRLEDVVQPLVADPLDLGLGERRVGDDLGEQLERRLEARRRARRPRPCTQSQPASAWSARRAARSPRSGRSRRSARSPRSAPAPRGRSPRPRPAGSSAAPLRRTSWALTSGRPGRWTVRTVSPLARIARSNGGKW